jgi:hypothetical protein
MKTYIGLLCGFLLLWLFIGAKAVESEWSKGDRFVLFALTLVSATFVWGVFF